MMTTYSSLELANAFILAGELPDALETLDAYLNGFPADDAARRLRADVLLRLAGSASAGLHRALADLDALATPQPEDHYRRSVLLERLHDADAALAAIRTARSAAPQNERLAEREVTLLVAVGRFDAARAAVLARLAALPEQAPARWRWLQWAGDLAVQQNDDSTAEGLYHAALDGLTGAWSTAPNNVYTAGVRAHMQVALGHIARRAGQFAAAAGLYAAAGAVLHADPVIRFCQGLVQVGSGETDAGTQTCQSAYTDASAVLRAEMRKILEEDPRYAPIGAALPPTPEQG